MQATPPKAQEVLPILAPLEPEPMMMEKPASHESTRPQCHDARNLFRGDSALLCNRANVDAVSIDIDSASSFHAPLLPNSCGDTTQTWAAPSSWQQSSHFSPEFRFKGQLPCGDVLPQASSSQGCMDQPTCCQDLDGGLALEGCAKDLENQSMPRGRRLEELPIELLVVVLHTVSVASMVSVVNLAATCKTCYRASETLLRDEPSVSRSIRQNQRIYQEIRAQLAKEERGRRWPRSRLTSRWVRDDGWPSPMKVMCEWPEVFPYFPALVCFVFATFTVCFSVLRLASDQLVSTQLMLCLLAGYGVGIECIAAACASYFCISYDSFLRALSVLFNALMMFQWAIGVLGGVLFFITGMQIVYMWVCIAFGFATWTTTKHCKSDFRPGYWKTNAIGALVFSSFSVIYFLMYTPDGSKPP